MPLGNPFSQDTHHTAMNNNPDNNPRYDIRGLYDFVTEVGRQTKNPYPLSFQDFSRVMQKEENRRGLYDKLSKRAGIGGTYEDFENAFFNPYASETNQVEALRSKTFTLDPRKEMARHRALLDASRGEYNPYGTSEVSYNPDRRMRGTNIAPIDLVESEDTLPELSPGPKTTRTFGGGVASGTRNVIGGAQIAVADLLKGFGGNSDDEKEAIHLIDQMEKDGTLSIERVRGVREKLLKELDSYTHNDILFAGDYSKKARQADALKLIEERMQRMGKDLTPEKRAIALDAMRSDLSEKGASEDKANPFVRWKEDAKDYIRKSEIPSGAWAELGSATASVGGALAGQAISMIPGAAPIGQAISWASIGAQTLSSGGQAIMDMEDYAAEKGVYITPEEKATIALGYMATEFGGDALGGAVASKSISAIGKLAGGGRIGQKLAVRSLAKGIAGNEGVRQSLSSLSEYAQKPLAIPLAKSAGRQIVRGAVTEGPGESLTTLAQNGALDRVWKSKEDQEAWADVARQAVKDGIYGAWAGALMGGFGAGIQSGQVARMHRKEGLTIVQDAENNLYEVIGSDKDQSAYLVLDRAGRQKMLPADQVVDAIHYTPEEREKSQKAYDEATEGLHPKEEVLTENQKRAGAILSVTEQRQSPIYRATHPEIAEEELNSPVALAGAKQALADVMEGQNEEVKTRVDQMALVLRDGQADPTEELTKLFSDESLSDNDRQSILDVVTAQSRLAAIERSHQAEMARMQSELTKEWSAKSVVGDETARGAVISATIADADGKPKQVYVTGGVRVVMNEGGTVELLPTDDGAPIYVYDESVEGGEKGHIVQMDDLSAPQLVAEDYLDVVQASLDEVETAFRSEVQQAEEQASQSGAGDTDDTTDDFMQSLPRTREGEVDGLRLMSKRPDDFIRYLGQLYGEDFVASLPLSKNGVLDLKALTPEQTLRVNEAALGKSGAVEAARQRRSQVGAERAKLEGEVKNDLGNLEKRMALRKASEEYRLYDDYVRTAEEQARQELEARRRAEEEALTPEELQKREEEKRRKEQEIKDREERIRLENERRRREREELERNAEGSTVREYTEDPPRQARARGARLVNGAVVYRQEPMTVEHYADAERAFSQRPGETRVPVKRTIVEAESLQASHKEGRMNPKHFIPEAQPKDRADNGLSSTAADRIASDIRPDEITGGITAYTGAPVVNGRGEVIQGNNRTDALQTMYDGAERHAKSVERYKEYLKAHASEYGMTAEQVEAMAHPVAVDVAEVSDSEAIRLGHRGQTDLESAGTDTMNAQTVGEELNSDTDPQSGQSMLVSFFNRIFNRTGANGAELSAKMDNMLNRNAEEGLKFLHENGYITDTQYKNAFETNSEGKRVVTAEAKTALKDVALYQLADVIGPRAMDIFYRLPASARNGLATFLYRDSQASFETSLAPDLGDALLVWDSLRQDPDFAGQTNFESAKIFILGKVSLFGRSELETNLGEASSLAKLLAASMQTQTEEQIASVLNNYYDLVGANATGAKTQSLIPTSQPTDTKAGAAEAVYGRVYEVPSGREKHYRFRRDVAEDFRARRDVAEDFRARRDALADRITEERRKRAAAADMARTFGVPLKLHEDMSTLPEEVRAGFDETHFVKGWFYKGDDAVHIYLPANVDADDVRATFLHEAVGHYGCRELLGEVGYNQVLDNLANKLGEEEVLRAMSEYCNGSQDLTDLGQVRIAMDEWIAHRAESGITKKTVWESIKDFFRNVFGLSGKQIDQSAEMMADDLLRRSAENLQKRSERQQATAPEGSSERAEVRMRAAKEPIGESDFGPVYEGRDFNGSRDMIAFLESKNGGEIINALYHPSVGWISLVWGKPGTAHSDGFGISKIVKFHPEIKGYDMQALLDDMTEKERTKNRVILENDKFLASVRLDWDGKKKTWLLTMFEKGSPSYDKTTDTAISPKLAGQSDTALLPEGLPSKNKGTESTEDEQTNESEKRFRRAERAGDVSGAAEAASDFMRNATPKNTSVDDVLRFLRVYHNSPHLLKKADGSFVDPETGERLGFDHRFMGSGEGAQAHGWGSYFSVKDLADYATPSADVFNGMHITENEAYVTSKGGSTNTAFILFLSIRDCCMKSSSTLNEKIVKKAVKEDLEERIQLTELYARREGRLLEALKDNEPWAVAATSNVFGGTIIDPKTGYKYKTHPDYSVDKVRLTYKGFQRSVDGYKDVLSFTENNPDYVKYFVEKAPRHKYSVEIPDPSVYEYINEREPLSDRATDLLFKAMREDPLPLGKLDPREVYGVSGGDIYRSIARKFQLNGDPSQKTHIGSRRAASEWLSRAGIVGIHYIGRVDGECFVIFNENDAKITDHYRFRRGEAHLAGVHTLTTENLRHALKMGGLANPSIAVYDTERGLPTRTFGEVALIAPRNLVDAKTGRHKGTYNRDAWTPTYPPIVYTLTKKGEDLVLALDKRIREATGSRGFLYGLIESNPNTLREDLLIKDLMYRENVREMYEKESPDTSFEQYVRDIADPILKERQEKLYDGVREDGSKRLVPHTLKNASRIMKREFSETSSWDPFVDTLTELSEIYRSLKTIRSHETLLTGKEESLYDALEKQFWSLASDLTNSKDDSVYYNDAGTKLLNLIVDGENLFGRPLTVTEEARVSALREQMKALPTDYFETKVDRPVGLSEFVEAVVPEGTTPELVAELEKSGLKVSTYDSTKEGAMNEAVLSAMDRADATDRGVRFRTGDIRDIQADDYGSKNRIVTKEEYANLIDRLRDTNTPLSDVDFMSIGRQLATFHIEAGSRSFRDFVDAMITDMGDRVRPYLKSFYNGARDLPSLYKYTNDMDWYDKVSKTDVTRVAPIDKNAEEETPAVKDTEKAKDTKKAKRPRKNVLAAKFERLPQEGNEYVKAFMPLYEKIKLYYHDMDRRGYTEDLDREFSIVHRDAEKGLEWYSNGSDFFVRKYRPESESDNVSIKTKEIESDDLYDISDLVDVAYSTGEVVRSIHNLPIEELYDKLVKGTPYSKPRLNGKPTFLPYGVEVGERLLVEDTEPLPYPTPYDDETHRMKLVTIPGHSLKNMLEVAYSLGAKEVSIDLIDSGEPDMYYRLDFGEWKALGFTHTENPKATQARHLMLTDPQNEAANADFRFRRAESAGDVSGAAEAASDFMRKATPKNASVDDVLRFLRVYHNSPHLLKKADGSFVDPETGERLGFDHRFMGSGEGAQAHGWGSYFSVKDLEKYALRQEEDVYNGIRYTRNDTYVISNGGSPDLAAQLFREIRYRGHMLGKNANEETIKVSVGESLRQLYQEYEKYTREGERLIEALKDNEPWAVTITSSAKGSNAIDPKTGYVYAPRISSVEQEISWYEYSRSQSELYKAALSFIKSNPDYVAHFTTKIPRHKYVVEIPDPDTNHYIEEDRQLTNHEVKMIRDAFNDNPEAKDSPLMDMLRRGCTGGVAYELLSLGRGEEQASRLLNKAGFVGIHYNGRQDGECYVIFNENDAKITDHYRFRRTERTDPKSMSDPINPQWDGEWYSPEDLTGKSTADLLELPAAPAVPEKRPTQSVAEYAETMSRHYADPRVRFRTGAHKESLRAPQPPRITDGMSLYEVAQLQHEYNRNYRDYLSSSMKRMDALVTTKGRFIRYMVDSARPVELFCKEMERMGIGMTPEQNVYQDLMTQSSRELNMRKQEVEPLVTKLTDRIRDLREQKLLDKVTDVSYTFTDEDTNETKTIKRADGYDKVSLYFQAKDIVECEQLGLVSRGREGFEKVVTEAGKPSNHITPEAYIASFEASIGKANAEALCDDMRKMSRWSIDRLHDAGLMTDDQYRSLTQSPRRYYAPQRGFKVTEESDRNAYERVEMTAEGRQSLSGDPIAYMQAIMNTTVMRVVRNQDLLHLYEWVTQHQQELARRGVLEIGETYYRKAGVDEEGNPIYMPSKQAPTIEELRHDTDVRRQVAKLRMEQKQLDQSHDKGETADYVYGIKSKEISNKISDLNNSIEILYRDPKPLRGDEKEQDEALRRTVKVYKDGVEQQIHFSPQYRGELVADVLNGRPSMDQDTKFYRSIGRHLENTGAINFVSKATRFMSALMTQYNPNFAVTNALRDYGTALISNVSDFGWGYQRAFMANYAKVQKTVLKYAMSDAYSDGTYPQGKYGTYLKEFFDEGAATGWSFLPDVVKIRQTMKEMSDPSLKQKFVNGKFGVANAFGLKQGVGMLTEASELNTRFAEYVTSRERGYSSKEATKHAKELTVNFNRKGTLAGVFGSFFGFWNASIQGTNKIVRLGKPAAAWCGTLFAGGLAQGLLYAIGAPDKDDERAFTEWEMMTNLCMGDVKIPLPQGFRGFWGAGVQMALAIAGKKDWQGGVIDGMQYLIGELLPNEAASLSNVAEWDDVTGNVELNTTKVLRDAMPTAIQPEMDVILNMDFMGNPVYHEPFVKSQEGQIAQRTLGKKRTKQVYRDIADAAWYAMGGSIERNDRMSRDGTHILPNDAWLNPSVIEHVFEGRTTGVGKTLADIATCVSAASNGNPSELRKLQIVNVLTKQEKDYSDSDRSYWKLMDFYRSRQQTMSNLRKAKEGKDFERYKKMTERVDAMAPRMTGEQLTEKIWEDGTKDEKLYVTWLETKALIKQIDKGKVTKEEVAPTIDRLMEQFRELR